MTGSVRVRFTLRLVVYRKSVCLGAKSLETHDQYFFSKWALGVIVVNVTSSLTRAWVCSLHLLLVLVSADILGSESRGDHDQIFLSHIRDSPNLEGQVPVFISPRNRVARLYPQALGSLFVASYDSQGSVGDIRPRLHTRSDWVALIVFRITFCTDRAENTVSKSNYIVVEACLPRRCLETGCITVDYSPIAYQRLSTLRLKYSFPTSQ
jgi:hypothetical protein